MSSPRGADHGHDRQRGGGPAEQQHGHAQEVAEPHASASAASTALKPSHAVHDQVGALDDRRRALVGAHAHPHGGVERALVDERRRARRRRRGRWRRRRRTARCARSARSTRSRTAWPLSIGTGGRISSTLRPQWIARPAASASRGDPLAARPCAASSSGAPRQWKRDDRALVLDPHAQRGAARACRARRTKRLHAPLPALEGRRRRAALAAPGSSSSAPCEPA